MVNKDCLVRSLVQIRIISGDKIHLRSNSLPDMREANIFTKGNFCPAFRPKWGGRELIDFSSKQSLCHDDLFGFIEKLGSPAILVMIGRSEEDRCQRYLAEELWQGQ